MKNKIIISTFAIMVSVTSFAKINHADLKIGKDWDCKISFTEINKTLQKENYLNFQSNGEEIISKIDGRVMSFTFEEDGLVSFDDRVQIALVLNSEKGQLKGQYLGPNKSGGKIKPLANISCKLK